MVIGHAAIARLVDASVLKHVTVGPDAAAFEASRLSATTGPSGVAKVQVTDGKVERYVVGAITDDYTADVVMSLTAT